MRRQTIILLVLFAVLAALTWYMQQPGNVVTKAIATTTSTPQNASVALVNPNSGTVVSISIQDASGKSVVLAKKTNLWAINDAKEGPADQNLAEKAASSVYGLMIVSRLSTPPDAAAIGLDKPAYQAEIKTDTASVSVKIGKATSTGSGYYASLADGSVVILSKTDVDTLIAILTNPPFPATPTPAVSPTPAATVYP